MVEDTKRPNVIFRGLVILLSFFKKNKAVGSYICIDVDLNPFAPSEVLKDE